MQNKMQVMLLRLVERSLLMSIGCIEGIADMLVTHYIVVSHVENQIRAQLLRK